MELSPGGTGSDAFNEKSARLMVVRRLVEQHEWNASGNLITLESKLHLV